MDTVTVKSYKAVTCEWYPKGQLKGTNAYTLDTNVYYLGVKKGKQMYLLAFVLQGTLGALAHTLFSGYLVNCEMWC